MNIKKAFKDMARPVYYKVMHARVVKLCEGTYNSLVEIKNQHVGKRCFIVANGPSLRMEDLEKIKDEYTFGVNRIYVVYDRTAWRPTYYLSQDVTAVRGFHDDIKKIIKDGSSKVFIRPTGQMRYDLPGAIYIDIDRLKSDGRQLPGFLSHINDEKFYTFDEGLTCIYTAMQLAAIMGFKEIYLLGADCYYSANNEINENSYADKRMYDPNHVGMKPQIEYIFEAYKVARDYFEKNGVIIKNATRGGKLEVFERVNFDSLFDGDKV